MFNVKCICGVNNWLTQGKTYTVLSETEEYYDITGDNGYIQFFR